MATPQQILEDYRAAFESGDSVTTTEILQYAKHDATLSEQLLALEEELLADAPAFDIDVDQMAAKVNRGGTLHRARDVLEAWIGDHAADIRASIRLLPFVAAIAFGICLYLLGAGIQPPTSWWLAVGAALCIGSIAVVCTSSLWRPYPRIPDTAPIDASKSTTDEPTADDDGQERIGGQVVVLRRRRVTTIVWGGSMVASLAVVAVAALQSSILYTVHSVNRAEYLIKRGELPTDVGIAVPLKLDFGPRPGASTSQQLTIEARLENNEFAAPWALTLVDSEGALIGTSHSKEEAALVSLTRYPADVDEKWLATIQVIDSRDIEAQLPMRWSLYASGSHTGFVEGEEPRRLNSEQMVEGAQSIRVDRERDSGEAAPDER